MTAEARVVRSDAAYFGLVKKVRSPGTASSRAREPRMSMLRVAVEAALEARRDVLEFQGVGEYLMGRLRGSAVRRTRAGTRRSVVSGVQPAPETSVSARTRHRVRATNPEPSRQRHRGPREEARQMLEPQAERDVLHVPFARRRLEGDRSAELGERRAPLGAPGRRPTSPAGRRASTDSGRRGGTRSSRRRRSVQGTKNSSPERMNRTASMASQKRCFSKSR